LKNPTDEAAFPTLSMAREHRPPGAAATRRFAQQGMLYLVVGWPEVKGDEPSIRARHGAAKTKQKLHDRRVRLKDQNKYLANTSE
jgi:hypothetical protein